MATLSATGGGGGPAPGGAPAAAPVALVAAARVRVQFLARWADRRPGVALSPEAPLGIAAQRSAAELASRGALSHRSLGTSSPLERYRRCGGTGRRVGEVIGVGATFDQIWQAWAASAAHAAVLDAEGWRRFGIATVEQPGGRILVVLLMGNSALSGVRTEVEWATVTIRAQLVTGGGDRHLPAAQNPQPPLLLGWNGRHLMAAGSVIAASWDPAAPHLRLEVPFDGRPAFLLVGVVQTESALPRYTDRLLIGGVAE